ncbi:MAG: hypothetical protein ACC628_16265 [Pirellulaceae bacterium]
MKHRGLRSSRSAVGLLLAVLLEPAAVIAASPIDHDGTPDVQRTWAMAKEHANSVRFSTLFTAQNVRDHLSTAEGLARAIRWCKETAVSHVYLETFRGGYTADRAVLLQAKRVFEEAGFLVSGCVTTTRICYGSLQKGTGPADVEAFRAELPRLFELAELIRGKQVRGVAAPKPANSDGGKDRHIYDFLGLLGIPLVPCTTVPKEAPAVFLALQTLKAPTLVDKLAKIVATGKPVLVTDHLAETLPATALLEAPNVRIFEVPAHDPGQSDVYWALMNTPADRLRAVRDFVLSPFGVKLVAPTRVALYLFDEDLVVVENFNDAPAGGRPDQPGAGPSDGCLGDSCRDSFVFGPRRSRQVRAARPAADRREICRCGQIEMNTREREKGTGVGAGEPGRAGRGVALVERLEILSRR